MSFGWFLPFLHTYAPTIIRTKGLSVKEFSSVWGVEDCSRVIECKYSTSKVTGVVRLLAFVPNSVHSCKNMPPAVKMHSPY